MKVLVVYYGSKTTFIQRDIDILSKHFDVDEISIRKARDIIVLAKKVKNCDVVFIWFAGKHAGISVLVSKLFDKKSVVVVGGYEIVNMSDIEYGLWYSGGVVDKYLCKYSIKNADHVVVVSKTHERDMLKIAKPKKWSVIYNGVPENFCGGYEIKNDREKCMLTVGAIKKSNIDRKGIGTFVKVAKYFPYYKFIIVGKPIDNAIEIIKREAPSNVKILGYLSGKELTETYKKCPVYLQLSAHEAFGVSVVESMLCGCIPVVTNRGALPEVVGDAGVIVEYGNMKSIVEGIKKALELSKRKEFVEKVIERGRYFTLEKREKELVKIIRKYEYYRL